MRRVLILPQYKASNMVRPLRNGLEPCIKPMLIEHNLNSQRPTQNGRDSQDRLFQDSPRPPPPTLKRPDWVKRGEEVPGIGASDSCLTGFSQEGCPIVGKSAPSKSDGQGWTHWRAVEPSGNFLSFLLMVLRS